MSARSLGRGYGTVIACAGHGCGAKSTTGQIRAKDHRAYLKTQGWGRGRDPGTVGRDAEPARPASVHPVSKKKIRARPARPAVEPRPRTLHKDLCPGCLKRDADAAKARKKLRLEQRDAARKARTAAKAA